MLIVLWKSTWRSLASWLIVFKLYNHQYLNFLRHHLLRTRSWRRYLLKDVVAKGCGCDCYERGGTWWRSCSDTAALVTGVVAATSVNTEAASADKAGVKAASITFSLTHPFARFVSLALSFPFSQTLALSLPSKFVFLALSVCLILSRLCPLPFFLILFLSLFHRLFWWVSVSSSFSRSHVLFFALSVSHARSLLILMAFITGNNSLELLLEGHWLKSTLIWVDGFSAGIEPETCG